MKLAALSATWIKLTLAFVVFWAVLLSWAATHDRLKIALVCLAGQACFFAWVALAPDREGRLAEERRRLWIEGVRADDDRAGNDDEDDRYSDPYSR